VAHRARIVAQGVQEGVKEQDGKKVTAWLSFWFRSYLQKRL